MIYSISISLNQYQWMYCIIYLLNNGFTNVGNDQISIDSSHSTVLLWDSFFLIIRSNQFAINIERILVQTIIWLVLSDWSHCHLWMFNVIVGSLVIIMTMMIEMNGWLIETTILIQYHCNNGKENSMIRKEGLIFW